MKKILLAAFAAALATTAGAQVFKKNLPEGDPYPGYNRHMVADPSLGVARRSARGTVEALPDHWNNGEQRYFPPIFSQGGYGSCGVSSHVGYMMTSEMNAYNNTDASLPENQLTPMFEYPFTYHGPGKDEMALYVGFPTADLYGGRYESSIYGGSECDRGDWGWVQGYDIFHNAMCHRISHAANFPNDVGTEAGREAVKRYLYNHNADPAFEGRGGIVCIGVGISKSGRAKIPANDNNSAIGVAGKEYMQHWNPGGCDHAMTIVGYDDRIQFDLDGNGVAGETENSIGQDENGAWIIANTWGAWGNAGFIYCPYALGGGVTNEVKTPGGQTAYKAAWYWAPYVYYWRGGYTPQRTMKVTMQYDHRSEISVQVGVAADTTATQPEKTFQFAYINYTGDGTGTDPAMPMLGTWADGKVHDEPMEFGVDLTDLSDGFDCHQPLKYFLIVNTKKTAQGEGRILSASVIDYELNANGVETPILTSGVAVANKGKTTIVGGVVGGEPLNAPLNAAITGQELTWTAPQATAYTPARYYIYKGGQKQGEATATRYALATTDGVWTVKAVYVIDGREYLSAASNAATATAAMSAAEAYDRDAVTLANGSFTIPGVADAAHADFTIEYWFKPSNLHNWGDFLFNKNWNAGSFTILTSANGDIQAGWNYNDCAVANGVLKNGTWAHVAVVVAGNKATIYVNGAQKATRVSSQYSGFAAFAGGLTFGAGDNALNGQMDELRLWGCARTAQEIKDNYQTPVVNPALHADLLAYLKMDTYSDGTATRIKDWAQGHDATVTRGVTAATLASAATIKEGKGTATAAISMAAQATVGQPLTAKGLASVGVTGYAWTAEGATPSESTLAAPSFVFGSEGDHAVTLTVTDISGATAEATATVSATSIEPTADFILSADSVKGSDRMSFVALNRAPGCRYLWQMPGADVETATTAGASASYSSVGTKTVTLTVTDPEGRARSASKTFEVTLAAPAVGYSLSSRVIMKGDSVRLTDRSAYEPSFAQWNLVSSNAYVACGDLNGTVAPAKAGAYDLSYTVGNAVGSSSVSVPRALIVCNTASLTGLNFYKGGDQTLTATLPEGVTGAWTLDFWLNPETLEASSLGIKASGDGSLALTSDASGNLTVATDGHSGTIERFYVANEWHHYAFTAAGQTVTAWRDGVKMGTATTGLTSYAALFRTLTIGGSDAPLKGNIDELRLWGKSLSQATLRSYATTPVDDVAKAMSADRLMVYYDFNQTLDNADDKTGNGATGIISGFENTVDYYTPSDGVFALDFDAATNEKVVGRQLNRRRFSVVEASDEETSRESAPASNAIDGNTGTFWHSKWGGGETGYPHSVTLHRDIVDTLRTIQVVYHSGHAGDRYRAGGVTIEQSRDGQAWTHLDIDHAMFSFDKTNVVLLRPAVEPYVRITFTRSLAESNLLCISEINFYGTRLDLTGIDDISDSRETIGDGRVYDLQGRPVEGTPRRGIYIRDGKKFVVR